MLIIIENIASGSKEKHPFNTATDVSRFLKQYPHLDHLRATAHDIKDLAAEICEEMSRHHMEAYTQESEHFEDPTDPWAEHKHNRGGEDEFMEWLHSYHAKDNDKNGNQG